MLNFGLSTHLENMERNSFSKQNVDILLFGDDIFYNEIQAKKEFAVGRVEVGRIKPAVFSQKNERIWYQK